MQGTGLKAALADDIRLIGKPFKRDNETEETYLLKWAAWEWLYNVASCRNIGVEVRLEGPAGRVVDLAAVGPGNTVYVVEVKASRSDFARDNHTREDLAALMAQERAYTARTGLAKATLIQAATFARREFPKAWREVPAYRQGLAGYRRMLRKGQTYKDRVEAYSIKFHDDRFMAIADYHYIIAPKEIVNRRSLPARWGLLDDTPRAASMCSLEMGVRILGAKARSIACPGRLAKSTVIFPSTTSTVLT